jgi:hypothetical protein
MSDIHAPAITSMSDSVLEMNYRRSIEFYEMLQINGAPRHLVDSAEVVAARLGEAIADRWESARMTEPI